MQNECADFKQGRKVTQLCHRGHLLGAPFVRVLQRNGCKCQECECPQAASQVCTVQQITSWLQGAAITSMQL